MPSECIGSWHNGHSLHVAATGALSSVAIGAQWRRLVSERVLVQLSSQNNAPDIFSIRITATRYSIFAHTQIILMSNASLLILLPLITFALAGLWMYRSKRKARAGLPPDQHNPP